MGHVYPHLTGSAEESAERCMTHNETATKIFSPYRYEKLKGLEVDSFEAEAGSLAGQPCKKLGSFCFTDNYFVLKADCKMHQ